MDEKISEISAAFARKGVGSVVTRQGDLILIYLTEDASALLAEALGGEKAPGVEGEGLPRLAKRRF